MRLRQIQDFLAVIEEGSIHAAARKAGLSQPAVTKSVRGLEAELHTQLLRRTNHGVVPTPAGRAFYARARAAHTELRKAEEEIAQLCGAGAGSVTFGVGPVAALLVAPEAVTRLHQQHPEAFIRIVEGFVDPLPMVRDETLDFAMSPPRRASRPRPLVPAAGSRGRRRGSRKGIRCAAPDRFTAGLGRVAGTGCGASARRAVRSLGRFSRPACRFPRQVVHASLHITFSVLARSDMLGIFARRSCHHPRARSPAGDPGFRSAAYAHYRAVLRKDPP